VTVTQQSGCYSAKEVKEQVDAAVAAERLKWDANDDGKIGLAEAIRALQVVAGMK